MDVLRQHDHGSDLERVCGFHLPSHDSQGRYVVDEQALGAVFQVDGEEIGGSRSDGSAVAHGSALCR
ncbi:hypothetical protein D3C81_1877320 [compost metagenome]